MTKLWVEFDTSHSILKIVVFSLVLQYIRKSILYLQQQLPPCQHFIYTISYFYQPSLFTVAKIVCRPNTKKKTYFRYPEILYSEFYCILLK